MGTALHASNSPCIVDQKDLNEALVTAMAHVAERSPQHCVEIFGISLRLALRFANMARQAHLPHGDADALIDLATTPAAVWRVVMTPRDVEDMQRGRAPMAAPHLEVYREVLTTLNEQVILLLLRYATQPRLAALVSGLGHDGLMQAMASASCSTLLQSAGHAGRPLVELTITETYLDRVFSTPTGVPVPPAMRALLARVMCQWDDYATLTRTLDHEANAVRPLREVRIGRPTAVFLPPGEADTIRQLIDHGVSTKTILSFTQSEVNSAQVRRLRQAADEALANAPMQSANDPESPRIHDSNAAVWGSAARRLMVTAIFAHQRVLVSLGLSPHAAFVDAYEYHCAHHKDPAQHMSLSRLISAVFNPLRRGEVHLGYCHDCGTMHLAHDGHHNGIECPVCALAKFNKLGRPQSSRFARVPTACYPAANAAHMG
ncbi:MAG: hypothetical protein RLZZ618_3655 [Pseudomonadota bacterium]